MIKNFVYLDSVWMDRPIADINKVKKVYLLINEKKLDMKFLRNKIVLEYLLEMENKAKERHPEYQPFPLGKFSSVKMMVTSFEQEKRKIYRTLEKYYFY